MDKNQGKIYEKKRENRNQRKMQKIKVEKSRIVDVFKRHANLDPNFSSFLVLSF
jgi:hypothetical protein